MNQEIYDKLSKYRSYLDTAHNFNYIRGVNTNMMNELTEIASELGIKYKYNHCPKCTLEFIKRLGGIYYDWETTQKAEEGSKETDNNRRGRKRNKVSPASTEASE